MRAGESAAALTRQLLAFSRKQVVKVEAVSIAEVLRGTQRMLRRLIGEAIELVVDPGPESLRVLADAGQLEQVVMNLAVNARDAMPEGGVLRIGAEEVLLDERDAAGPTPIEPGRWARLRVADTGCGMDESTLARIFEPFFTTKGPGIGTGLGLATVHGIVAQYGGAVRVRSAPGEGATFDVYLPAVEAPGAEREAAAAVSPFDARAGETLLVVEDDEAVLEVLRDVLEGARYRVVAARDGLAGIDAAAREPGRIHLVLTDVVMPRLSGPEMIARLSRTHPESRVLYMSGYIGESPSHRHLLDSGAALLQKPFLPDELLRRVREVLDAPRYG
jgi:CheY-like chemotaxis protein